MVKTMINKDGSISFLLDEEPIDGRTLLNAIQEVKGSFTLMTDEEILIDIIPGTAELVIKRRT